MTLRFLPDPAVLGALGPARAARLLEERARGLARRGAEERPAGAPLLLLAVGAEIFGAPLDQVAEVLPAAPLCPFPPAPAGAAPGVLGLRARAGRLHAVLDLAVLLGVAAGASPDGPPGGGPHGAAAGHDVLLHPRAGRRLALRTGRALSVASPVPLPADRAPAGSGEAVLSHATMPGGDGAIVAVLDLDRLLRPYAAPASPALGA